MLDPRKIMIICNGVDKTSSIADYEFDETSGKYIITYEGAPKKYTYSSNNVALLEPQKFDVSGKHIFYRGGIVGDYEEILLFAGGTYRFLYVVKNSGKDFKAPESSFTISDSADLSPAAQKVFSYLRAIAGLTKSEGSELPEGEDAKSFLAKVYEGLDFIHPESALAAYLNGQAISKVEAQKDEFIFPFRFNLSQKAALEEALTHSVCVIDGPPGTGKTQTILNILANLTTMQGKSVGVVSFNNEAVKNVKDKLDKNKYGFLVADLGRAEKRKNFFENLPAIDVGDWNHQENLLELQSRIKELNGTLTRLLADDNRRARLLQELAAFQLEREHFEQYYLAQQLEEIRKLPFYTSSSDLVAEYLADVMLEDKLQPGLKFLHKLKFLFKYKEFRWNRLNAGEVEHLLRLQRKFYELKLRELEEEIQAIEVELKKYSFRSLQDEHQRVSERIFQKKLFESHGNLEQPEFSIKEYKKDYAKFAQYFPIVISTNHSIRNSLPPDILLDYIIIDEASQVDLLTAALALSCCRNLIVVGDLKQLPQIVNERIKDELEDWDIDPAYDYFSQSILSSLLSLYPDDLPRIILKEHYRCHPKIIQFCNQKYYAGELIPFTNADSCQTPLMLYKTSKGNHMRRVTHRSGSGRYNQRELDVIKEEVLANSALASDDIGLATPYRKQVRKAAHLADVKSDTIHKFQGRENDVIIMSTVLDNSQEGKDGLGFVDDACLINVAVSRAKKQFILVTDTELFQNSGHHLKELLRYIQYNTLDEHVIESQVVSVFDLLYKNYSVKLEALKSKIWFRSNFKSENIMNAALEGILAEPRYFHYDFTHQVLLRNVIKNFDLLDKREAAYVNNRASVDFLIYSKQDKKTALIVEVDGFEYHENDPQQLERDQIKNSILVKYKIPFLRLPTNGSGEIQKVKNRLDEIEASA